MQGLVKRVDFIRRFVQIGAKAKLLHALERLGPSFSSVVFRQLPLPDQQRFFELIGKDPFFEKILIEVPEETLVDLLSFLSEEQLVSLLSSMSVSLCALYLRALSEGNRDELLKKIPKELRDKIQQLTQYPKGCCAEQMDSAILSINIKASVGEAIDLIQHIDSKLKIFYMYVVDDENHLLGTAPLRSLIREKRETSIADVMLPNPITVQALDPRGQAARVVGQHKLLAIPVVDETHHLLGVIRVDDVMDMIEEEATEEMYRMAGLTSEDRIFAPWSKTLRKRLVWLTINLLTAFLAASVVSLFEKSIAAVVALAVFMPVVAGMGGNGGTQSLTVMTRALALGELSDREIRRVMSKEIFVGLMIGVILGAVTGLVAWGFEGSIYLGVVLWLAMIVNMTVASFSGSMVPILLRFFKLDPALGSSVIVTTFTDVFGFLAFLGFATLFLKYLIL